MIEAAYPYVIYLLYGHYKPIWENLEKQSALTEESAVGFDEDWLINRGYETSQFAKTSFIKPTLDDRFWLDKHAMDTKARDTIYLTANIGAFTLVVLLLVFVFLELTS